TASFGKVALRISRGNLVSRRQNRQLHAAAGANSASERSRDIVAKAASISPLVLALRTRIWSPAAFCTSRIVASALTVLPALITTAMRTALGSDHAATPVALAPPR